MLKCAVFDDEIAVFEIIKKLLTYQDIPIESIIYAEDGKKGRDILLSECLDLVFIDIQMPFIDGFQLIKEFPNFNYIIVTAFDYFNYAQKALRLGAKDILLKPIDKDKLMESLKRVLGYQPTQNSLINNIIDDIHKNYTKTLKTQYFAKKYYMQCSNLCRLFKKETGYTVSTYIKLIRINKAKEKLKISDLTISEICFSVGYRNESLFYRDFKKINGITPQIFRQSQKDINR